MEPRYTTIMKIELPTSIINQLLIESETFRRYIIENHMNAAPTDGIESYRYQVRMRFPDWSRNKIPAIKWIRDLSRNNQTMLDVFAVNGYESYTHALDCDNILTLASAKRFVDSIK